MSYGLEIDGFAFTYGAFSVIAKGTVPDGTVSIAKADHTDITDFRVVFTPIGVRSPIDEEIRPSYSQTGTHVTIDGTGASSHNYILLGR